MTEKKPNRRVHLKSRFADLKPAFLSPSKNLESGSEISVAERHSQIKTELEEEYIDLFARYRDFHDNEALPGMVLRLTATRHAEHISLSDLSFMRKYIHSLEEAVGKDGLTGAENRRQYDRYMRGRFDNVERKRRTDEPLQPFALAIIDIDHFKAVNTAGGHPAGDIVLQEMVRIVNSCLHRASDELFRYGGEEFVVAMPDTTIEAANKLMEQARAKIESELLPAVLQRMQPSPERDKLEKLGHITASFGLNTLGEAHQKPEDLFAETDIALYAAKRGKDVSGATPRNRVARFDPSFRNMMRDDGANNSVPGVDASLVQGTNVATEADEVKREVKSPSEIFDDNKRKFDFWLRHHADSNVPRKLYPVDPMQGLQFLFAKPEVHNSILAFSDGSDMQRVQVALDMLRENMTIDTLTGLPNRKAFDETLRRQLGESTRDHKSRGVIVFDVDHFKRINDGFGHAVGDIVLHCFGKVLEKATRAGEFVARIGGEEFGVIIEADDMETLTKAAERFRSTIQEKVMESYKDFFRNRRMTPPTLDREAFTASLGLVLSELNEATDPTGRRKTRMIASSPEQLYAAGDKAMYVAKGKGDFALQPGQTNMPTGEGRNRWVVYNPHMESIDTKGE